MQQYSRTWSDQGEPLVLLHGLFGHHGNWAALARELASEFAVTAIDLRNHGRSPHASEHDYQAMAADLQETLDDLGLDVINLIGHSMGGKVAMQFALDFPHRVKSLTVVDIAPVSYPPEEYVPLQALNAVDLNRINGRPEAAEILAGFLEDQAVIDFLLSNLQRAGDVYKWRFNLKALTGHYADIRDWPAHTAIFPGPVLFIKGSDSDYISQASRENILTLFPSAQLKIINGAGHWVHSEKPHAFLKVATDFLATV